MPSAPHAAIIGASSTSTSQGSGASSYDWSDTNLPWTVQAGHTLTEGWPSSALNMIVDIQVNAANDFVTNLDNTIAAHGGPCIIRLQAGVYHIKNFSHPQTTSTYGLGYYNANLRGFLGQGADQTFIQMDANSYTTAQLNTISTLTAGSNGNPIGFSMLRFGSGSGGEYIYNAGLTFRGCDQQTISNYDSSTGISSQPAPYGGVGLSSVEGGITQYVRFQASAHAATSQPPFECGSINSQYSTHTFQNVEVDGRLSPDIDASQPRRSGTWLGNNESAITWNNAWFHHSNRSRYAVNDGNRATFGTYAHANMKIEHISEINDGLGGQTNAACAGYENCAATITWNSPIFHQDNSAAWNTAHVGLTTVSSQSVANPQGGHITIADPVCSNVFSAMDGYLCMRIVTNTHWYTDGINNTVTVTKGGTRLQYYIATSQPTSASLSAAGVSPDTHFIVFTS